MKNIFNQISINYMLFALIMASFVNSFYTYAELSNSQHEVNKGVIEVFNGQTEINKNVSENMSDLLDLLKGSIYEPASES